jgi:hypothetical protein
VGCYGITSGNGSRRAPQSHWVQSCFQRYPRLVSFRRASLLRPLASFLISFVLHFRFFNVNNDPSFASHNYYTQTRLAYSVARLHFSSVVLSHQRCGRFTLFFSISLRHRACRTCFWVPFFLAIGRRSPMGAQQVVSCHLFVPRIGLIASFLSSICNFPGMGTRHKDDTKIP